MTSINGQGLRSPAGVFQAHSGTPTLYKNGLGERLAK
jgi:hypothetical protein